MAIDAAKKKGVRAVLLVEDDALERFVRFTLLELGFSPHEIRVRPYPVGRGSAKRWVEQQYPVEVREYRRVARYQKVSLEVGTDADEQAVQQRFDRLADELSRGMLEDRSPHERIVIVVPKWSVETWVRAILKCDVGENTDAKRLVEASDFKPAAKELVAGYRVSKHAEVDVLPSMKVAFSEMDRLG